MPNFHTPDGKNYVVQEGGESTLKCGICSEPVIKEFNEGNKVVIVSNLIPSGMKKYNEGVRNSKDCAWL